MSVRPTWFSGLPARSLEYVTMTRALADAHRLPQAERTAASGALAQAEQKRDAAEALLRRGAFAEAITLACDGASLVRDAVNRIGDSPALNTRCVRRALDDVDRASSELSPLPVLDRAVTRAQRNAVRMLLRAHLSLERPLREALLDRKGLLRLRAQRAVAAALIVLSPLGAVAFWRASVLGMTARASGVLDDQYTADRVLDGDPDTEWVSSGGDEWLELRFRPRVVHTVRILNGDTLPDRAVKSIRVELYDNVTAYPTSTRYFDRQHPPQWQTFNVAGTKCDRIRVVVESHYGAGAAIAEVQVD